MDPGRLDVRLADPLARLEASPVAERPQPVVATLPSRRRLSWTDPRLRAGVYQLLALTAVGVLVWYLVSNTLANLAARNIATGFDFLHRQAGFAIGETLIPFQPSDSYLKALTVGLLNTLRVAVIGVILATILGVIIGIARLSSNWLVAKLSAGYVEIFRNLPLLLQLFFWYALITETLPGPREALRLLPGVFVSNRGVKIPVPAESAAYDYAAGGFILAVILTIVLHFWSRRRREAGRGYVPVGWLSFGLLIVLPVLGWLLSGAALAWDVPQLQGFNFVGGATLSPEFTALLVGLVIYTAAFIAEIVRSGILAVSRGQREAAQALALTERQTMSLVVLPQALRIIVPPLTSQYLAITKNSSLAVAVGYPDLVSVAGTTLNQTGQAIEGVAIIMLVFLTISLSIALFMNWYNKRIALVER
jgi:general L-amino acid transport system permease protein